MFDVTTFGEVILWLVASNGVMPAPKDVDARLIKFQIHGNLDARQETFPALQLSHTCGDDCIPKLQATFRSNNGPRPPLGMCPCMKSSPLDEWDLIRADHPTYRKQT